MHIKDDFASGAPISQVPASWFNRVAKFINSLTGGVGVTLNKRDDGGASTLDVDFPSLEVGNDKLVGTDSNGDAKAAVDLPTTPDTQDDRYLCIKKNGVVLTWEKFTTFDVGNNKLVGTDSNGDPIAAANLPTSVDTQNNRYLCVKKNGTALTWETSAASTPENPSSYNSCVTNGEGTSASQSTSHAYNGSKGVKITICTRVFYDHTANFPVLKGFYRTLTFDKNGLLYSVSGESQYVIDEPVVGNLTT